MTIGRLLLDLDRSRFGPDDGTRPPTDEDVARFEAEADAYPQVEQRPLSDTALDDRWHERRDDRLLEPTDDHQRFLEEM